MAVYDGAVYRHRRERIFSPELGWIAHVAVVYRVEFCLSKHMLCKHVAYGYRREAAQIALGIEIVEELILLIVKQIQHFFAHIGGLALPFGDFFIASEHARHVGKRLAVAIEHRVHVRRKHGHGFAVHGRFAIRIGALHGHVGKARAVVVAGIVQAE